MMVLNCLSRKRVKIALYIFLIGVLSLILYDYIFIMNDHVFRDIEMPNDVTSVKTCDLLDYNRYKKPFIYMFKGCQLDEKVIRSIHPDVKLVSDTSSGSGDIILNGSYTYDTLANKSKALISYFCENKFYDIYDLFIKKDEDCFIDTSKLLRINGDCAGYWEDDHFIGLAYLYNSDVLKEICTSNLHKKLPGGKWEDQELSKIVNEVSKSKCSLRDHFAIHKFFRNNRLQLYFRPYIKCEESEHTQAISS